MLGMPAMVGVRTMRWRELCSEALRNIGTGAARAVWWFLALLLAGLLLGGYEAMTVIGQEREASSRIAMNADVRVLTGGSPVDGVACDGLTGAANGPQASGAMRKGPQVEPASTPGADLSSYEVTDGMIRLLAVGDADRLQVADASGIWVSADVARDFGMVEGGVLETTDGTVRVAGVFDWPNDGRDTRFGYAVIVPVGEDSPSSETGATTFEECWAKQWPVNPGLDSLMLATVVAGGGDAHGQASGVMGLNRGVDSRYDAAAAYASRSTRMMPVLGLALGALIGVLSVRRRRLEYAGALHSGQRKVDLLAQVGVETLIWGGEAVLAAVSLLTAYTWRWSLTSPASVLLAAVRTPMAMLCGLLLGGLACAAGIRESQLFRYFKAR